MTCIDFFPLIRYFLHTFIAEPFFFSCQSKYTKSGKSVFWQTNPSQLIYIANPSIYLQFAHTYIIILSRNLTLAVKNGDIAYFGGI